MLSVICDNMTTKRCRDKGKWMVELFHNAVKNKGFIGGKSTFSSSLQTATEEEFHHMLDEAEDLSNTTNVQM